MKITIYIKEENLETLHKFINGDRTIYKFDLLFYTEQPFLISTLVRVSISYDDYIILKEWVS